MKWYKKVKEAMINCEYPHVKVFVLCSELDKNHTKPHILQQWVHNVKEMYNKAEKLPKNDIRRYFEY